MEIRLKGDIADEWQANKDHEAIIAEHLAKANKELDAIQVEKARLAVKTAELLRLDINHMKQVDYRNGEVFLVLTDVEKEAETDE